MAKTYTPSTVHPSAEKELRDALTAKLLHNFSVQPESATNEHFYNALVLVLRDGTRVEIANSFGGGGAGWAEQSGFFTRPVDLAQVAYLLWGETEIPLN